MTQHDVTEHAAVPTADRLASFTRREGLRKAAYIAPAIIALNVAVPAVTLGRSGPTGKPANPGSTGQNIATEKSQGKVQGPKK